MTGLAGTTSAYGWPVVELLAYELHEGVGVHISLEVSNPSRAVRQFGKQSPNDVPIGPGDDNGGALADQPAGKTLTAGHRDYGDGAAQPGRAHSCPSGDAANASSTSARDS